MYELDAGLSKPRLAPLLYPRSAEGEEEEVAVSARLLRL